MLRSYEALACQAVLIRQGNDHSSTANHGAERMTAHPITNLQCIIITVNPNQDWNLDEFLLSYHLTSLHLTNSIQFKKDFTLKKWKARYSLLLLWLLVVFSMSYVDIDYGQKPLGRGYDQHFDPYWSHWYEYTSTFPIPDFLGNLGFWFTELLERNAQLRSWGFDGHPNVLDDRVLQSTGILDRHETGSHSAHKSWALDCVIVHNDITRFFKDGVTSLPAEGMYVHGMYLDGE